MSKAWKDSQHKGNALLLLLAIADMADDDGWCWPSIAHLAHKVRVTPSSIIRTTKKLEQSGELIVLHNRRTGNKYLVCLGLTDQEKRRILKQKAPYLTSERVTSILLYSTGATSDVAPVLDEHIAPVLEDPSITINESSIHVATPRAIVKEEKEPSTPSETEHLTEPLAGEALLDAFGIQPAPRQEVIPTPHWTEQTRWGDESEEFQRQVARFGGRGVAVRNLGEQLEKQFGLRPDWKRPKEVKSWASGLATCLDKAEGKPPVVLRAARQLREAGLAMANPYSLHKTIDSLMAEQRCKPDPSKPIRLAGVSLS